MLLIYLALNSWSLWRCFVMLFAETQFPSVNFPFLALSSSSHVRFRPFVTWNIPIVVFFLCCSVDHFVVCAVSGQGNLSVFALFYVVFASLCWRYLQFWRILFLLLFFIQIVCQCHLLYIRPYIVYPHIYKTTRVHLQIYTYMWKHH